MKTTVKDEIIFAFYIVLVAFGTIFSLYADENKEKWEEQYISYVPFSKENNISAYAATDYTVWVWCNICHKHIPEVNGKLYDICDNGALVEHPHQNGYSFDNNAPIGDFDNREIAIIVCILFLFCGCRMSIKNLNKNV